MIKVIVNNTEYDFEQMIEFMNDDIREKLHNELSPCTEQEFINEYLKRDSNFIEECGNALWSNEIEDNHWLEVICKEEDTNPNQIAKIAEVEKDVLYKLIQRNSSFKGMSLTTMESIAIGLGLTPIEFLSKYKERFMGEK